MLYKKKCNKRLWLTFRRTLIDISFPCVKCFWYSSSNETFISGIKHKNTTIQAVLISEWYFHWLCIYSSNSLSLFKLPAYCTLTHPSLVQVYDLDPNVLRQFFGRGHGKWKKSQCISLKVWIGVLEGWGSQTAAINTGNKRRIWRPSLSKSNWSVRARILACL